MCEKCFNTGQKKWQRMEMENVQQGKRTIKYNQAYTIFIIFIYHHAFKTIKKGNPSSDPRFPMHLLQAMFGSFDSVGVNVSYVIYVI